MATCIFCLSEGPLTFEHLYPAWLVSMLPGRLPVEVNNGSEKGTGFSYTQRRLRAGARVVCASCNNGWMAAMESECRESLLKVFVHDRLTLTSQDIRNLVRWSIKTAIVASHARSETRGRLSLLVSNAMFHSKFAPPHALVYLGSYRGGGLHGFRIVKEIPRFLEILNVEEEKVEIYDWTAAIVAAVFKVILLPPQLWQHSLQVEFPERRPLAPVWPDERSALEWPVLPAHADSDVVLSSYAILSGRIEVTSTSGGSKSTSEVPPPH